MTSLHRPVIHKFIEYQQDNLDRFFHRLSVYYNNSFNLHLLENFNDYLLYFTIIITIITFILILYIIFESNYLLKYLLSIYSLNEYLFSKRKNEDFRSKTSFCFLNWLLNSPNRIQTRFFNEFLHSLNQKFLHKKVIEHLDSISIILF